ncbi:MAG: hypothetical protein K2X94_00080 [Amoebophilaceae bacterium]|nr:hypothetical protein [Amoebophilaceae bacterium]
MIKANQVIKVIITISSVASVVLAILQVEKKYSFLPCQQVEITIKAHNGQSFITQHKVLDLVNAMYNSSLIGRSLKQINTYKVKKTLESQPLIKKVGVFKTLQGVLKIDIATKYVLARIIDTKGPGYYLDENGALVAMKGLPLLSLLVVDGIPLASETIQNKALSIHHKRLLELLHYIYKDPFLSCQITTLQLINNDKIILGTAMGNYKIEFGRAEKFYEKFQKLRFFYSYVVPYKGSDGYHRINLEFDNQLICE